MDIKDFGRFLNGQQMNKRNECLLTMNCIPMKYSIGLHQSPKAFWGTGDVWAWGYMARPAVGRIGACSGPGFQ